MPSKRLLPVLAALAVYLAACGARTAATPEAATAAPGETAAIAHVEPRAQLTEDRLAACAKLGLDPARIAELEAKPLYQFNEAEVHLYLGYVQELFPNLRDRITYLARKNIGQPYEIYLLGEAPFETYDPQPLYCLDRSDCVVFSEHTYAMALSHDWPTFFRMLQRIRYKEGQIGVATRNHYTEADWDVNNTWLVRDISEELGGADCIRFTGRFDRAKFLRERYKLETDIPIEKLDIAFVPYEKVAEIADKLQPGDFVNVMRGVKGQNSYWAGHVGLITRGADGTVNFLHSTPPKVREEPIAEYIRRSTENLEQKDADGKARLFGFKFLRLEENPVGNLVAIDGPAAPRIQPPPNSAPAGN